MATTLASVFTGRPIRGDLAMTEESTLSGEVVAVGDIKEKVLTAHRCGLARVILPRQTASRSRITSATTSGPRSPSTS